jgi:hypothetical protein
MIYILRNKEAFENLIRPSKSLGDIIKLFKDEPGLQIITQTTDQFLSIVDILMQFTNNNNIVS